MKEEPIAVQQRHARFGTGCQNAQVRADASFPELAILPLKEQRAGRIFDMPEVDMNAMHATQASGLRDELWREAVTRRRHYLSCQAGDQRQ